MTTKKKKVQKPLWSRFFSPDRDENKEGGKSAVIVKGKASLWEKKIDEIDYFE